LGYSPNVLAQNFRLGSTGIVLVLTSEIGDPFYGQVISGISRIARARGLNVRVQEVEHGHLAAGELERIAKSRQVDGIIVLGEAGPFPASHSSNLQQQHLPIVVCGETADPELTNYPRFQIDGYGASAEMTEYLIRLGHRKIAFMRGQLPMLNMDDREAGYRNAMTNAALPIQEEWLCNGKLAIEGARRAIAELLITSPTPTAIICANDEMALGAMAELNSRGIRVPEDISVVGFDNTRYAEVINPPLTTIAQPAEEIGERGMYCLVQLMKGEERHATVEYLPHKLIIRHSARALPSEKIELPTSIVAE
jgi:LacI family repressor for deo operon, udp, cdd, tsx, nupC, and nupG